MLINAASNIDYSISFDLAPFDDIPGVFFIAPLALNSDDQGRPTSSSGNQMSSGIFGLASSLGNMGLSAVGSIVGQTKMEDATFEVLNKFSQLTRMTKNAGMSVAAKLLRKVWSPESNL